MGNRLSGLWCKKTTTLHINNEPNQQQQQQTELPGDNSICNNNKSQRKKSAGAGGGGGRFGGTFRFGSARRLSLTSCVSKDKKSANKSTNNEIATIEQQYQQLLANKPGSQPHESQSKTAMKVNAQLPTVKVSKKTHTYTQTQLESVASCPLFMIRCAQCNYSWEQQHEQQSKQSQQ